jgi:hypothetical protein
LTGEKLFTISKEEARLGFSFAVSRYFAIALFAAIVAGIIEIIVF